MPEKYWRLLNVGEKIKRGDEIFTINRSWRSVSISIGSFVSAYGTETCIRRELSFWPHDDMNEIIQSGTWAGCSYEVVDGMFELQNVFVGGKKLKLKVKDI